jgi:hypothetical protein
MTLHPTPAQPLGRRILGAFCGLFGHDIRRQILDREIRYWCMNCGLQFERAEPSRSEREKANTCQLLAVTVFAVAALTLIVAALAGAFTPPGW